MRRLASLLMFAGVAVAVSALAGRPVRAAWSEAAAKKSPFPGGLSPQWLNAANVEPTACLAKLAASGAKYRVLPAQTRPDAKGCGVPHGVIVTPRGRFLRNVAIRLKRESGLTHVLTPDFNAEHRNHFHLDRGLPFGWWWDDGG